MKILITSDLYYPQVNGVVTSVINLYTELKKLGMDVKILTLSKDMHSHINGDIYYVKSFSTRIYPDIRASVFVNDKILKELIDWSPDIIHTQCEFSTLLFAKIIENRCKCPIVHTYHTMYEYYVKYIIKNEKIGQRLLKQFIKDILRRCDCIIAPTMKAKESLQNFGLKNNIIVIPTGIDLSKFDIELTNEEKILFKEKYNIPKDNFILLNLGRIAQEKNIDEIISNFKNLNNKNITLFIVGDGPYRNNLENLVKKENIKNVIFSGMIAPNEIYKPYKISDIFVCASQSETQGLTYLEAIANGLPLVCKYDNCLEDLLIEEYNGYYFANNQEFNKYCLKIYNDKELNNILSKNAKEHAIKYSKENFAKSIYDLYVNIINEYEYIPFPLMHYKKIMAKIKNQLKRTLKIIRLMEKLNKK